MKRQVIPLTSQFFPSLWIVAVLLIATFPGFTILSTATPVGYEAEWRVPSETLVYKITELRYNGTTQLPVESPDGADNNAYLGQGNLLKFEINWLPDPNGGDNVELTYHATHVPFSVDYFYQPQLIPQWGMESVPPFMHPIIAVPVNSSVWFDLESDFNSMSNMTASYDSVNHLFQISGGNATCGANEIHASWDTRTGIIQAYSLKTADGGEGIPLLMNLEFKTFQNLEEWDMYWGVEEGGLLAFRWNTILVDGRNFLTITGNDTDLAIYEGDLTIFEIDELPNFLGEDQLIISMTLFTPSFTTPFLYELNEIGSADGPELWYPFIPLGNDAYFENITVEFMALPALVSYSETSLNVTYDTEEMHQTADWDLQTGVLNRLIIDGIDEQGEEISVDLSLVYYTGPLDADYVSTGELSNRYIVLQAQNGTQNFLDFGPSSPTDPTHFLLYTDDLFRLNLYHEGISWKEPSFEGSDWNFRFETWRGFTTEGEMYLQPPGLELAVDGPPAFYPIIPVGDENYWNTLASIYTNLGYNVTNTDELFGIQLGYYRGTLAFWCKNTGILDYYYVALEENGHQLVFEIQRGVDLMQPLDISWGVQEGDLLIYQVDILNVNGNNTVPFGDHDEGSLTQGDKLQVTFTQLEDLNLEDHGPTTHVDIYANGITEHDSITEMEEPGFELARVQDDLLLLYWALPVGPTEYWNTLKAAYEEAPIYTVTENATVFSVYIAIGVNEYVSASWNKTTGVLLRYEAAYTMGNDTIHLVLRLINSSIQPAPTTTPPSTTAPVSSSTQASGLPLLPGFRLITVLPVLLVVIPFVVKRKR